MDMSKSINKIGRPTKYNDDLQAQADEYIFKYKEVGDVIPSRVGLCCYLGISKRVSYEWETIYPAFLHTLCSIEALQERTAINRGLDNTFNSAITKLILYNHGYSDKQEHNLRSDDGSMSPRPAITAVDAIEAAKQYQKIMGNDG